MKTIIEIEWNDKDLDLTAEKVGDALNKYWSLIDFTVRELPLEENRCGKCGKWYQGGAGACLECNPRKSCENCGTLHSICDGWKAKPLPGKCLHWQPIPGKVDPSEAVRTSDKNLLKLLNDCATCLDDCLIRIYPEEFKEKHINEASERFLKDGGTIARIDRLVERIKEICHAQGEKKNEQ